MRFLVCLSTPTVPSCRYMDQRVHLPAHAPPREFLRWKRPALGNVGCFLNGCFQIHPAPGILGLQNPWPAIMNIHHSLFESWVTMTNPVSTYR